MTPPHVTCITWLCCTAVRFAELLSTWFETIYTATRCTIRSLMSTMWISVCHLWVLACQDHLMLTWFWGKWTIQTVCVWFPLFRTAITQWLYIDVNPLTTQKVYLEIFTMHCWTQFPTGWMIACQCHVMLMWFLASTFMHTGGWTKPGFMARFHSFSSTLILAGILEYGSPCFDAYTNWGGRNSPFWTVFTHFRPPWFSPEVEAMTPPHMTCITWLCCTAVRFTELLSTWFETIYTETRCAIQSLMSTMWISVCHLWVLACQDHLMLTWFWQMYTGASHHVQHAFHRGFQIIMFMLKTGKMRFHMMFDNKMLPYEAPFHMTADFPETPHEPLEHLQEPVPSPAPVRNIHRLHGWWLWFWMFSMTSSSCLNPEAPSFCPQTMLTAPMRTAQNRDHQNRWGEGWQPSTGLSATPDDLLACMTFAEGVKLRGMRSPDLILRQAKKRSLKRAFSRVLAHGSTWYRGQHVTLRDFNTQPGDIPPPKPLGKPYTTDSQPAGRHAPQRRLKTFCWNVGGLTQERFQELKIWLHQQQMDVAILAETNWLDTREFADSNWTCVHSGSGNRHTGVMLMFAKKLCPSRNISWHEVIPGRVLHARVFGLKRPLDVLGIYQYVHKHEYLDDRIHLFEVLQRYIERLPNRNMLCLAGDFNCHLTELPGQTGPALYHWRGRRTSGAQHSDQHHFAHFVQQLQLIALSGRNATEGPTYHHPLATSRIDHCFTRLATADGLAKQVKHLWDFPMNGDGGHIPLLFTLPLSWIPYRPAVADFRFTYQQRLLTRTLCRDLDPRWTDFVQSTNTRLDELARSGTDHDTLDRLHALMRQQCVILQQCPRPHTALSSEVNLHHALQRKWAHFKGLKRPQLTTLPAIFRCWHHFSKHQLLQKQQKPLTDLAKRAKIDILQAQAARAADRHDMYTLYRVINKMSPKHQQTDNLQISLRPLRSCVRMSRRPGQTTPKLRRTDPSVEVSHRACHSLRLSLLWPSQS